MRALRSKMVQKPLCWAHSEFLTLRKSTAGASAGWEPSYNGKTFRSSLPLRHLLRCVQRGSKPDRCLWRQSQIEWVGTENQNLSPNQVFWKVKEQDTHRLLSKFKNWA